MITQYFLQTSPFILKVTAFFDVRLVDMARVIGGSAGISVWTPTSAFLILWVFGALIFLTVRLTSFFFFGFISSMTTSW